MRLKVAQLTQHLRGTLAPVYVIAGDEPLLIEEALDQLREAGRRAGHSERQVLHVERGFDWSLAHEACAAMSLFGDRRIVELRLPTGNPGSDGAEALRQLIERPNPDTVLLVVCGSLDHRQRNSAWYTGIEEAGASIYAWAIDPETVPDWLAERLARHGLKADDDALELLARRTEGNLLAARQDVDKLALLYPGATLGVEQVRAAVADSARYDVDDLIDAMLVGDGSAIARTLRHLLDEGTDVVGLIAQLTWVVRQWGQAQLAFQESHDAQDACRRARIPQFRSTAMQRALKRSRAVLIYALTRDLAGIDDLSKRTGGKEQAAEELLTWLLRAGGSLRPQRPKDGSKTSLAGA